MSGLGDYGIVGVLLLAIIMLIKDLVIPMWKKLNGKGNPINLSRLYQEFKDFKETQEEWNEKIEKKLGIWEPNKNRRR